MTPSEIRSTSCRMWLETMTWRPSLARLLEEIDHLGPTHGIETVERLVEDQDPGVVAEGVGELDPLPHALGVAGDPPLGGVGETDPFERLPRARSSASARRNSRAGRGCGGES